MSEGAVLKKKFDDIFESSRYTKALEAFAKSKKDFQSQGKDHKAELMQVGAYLETARGLQEEMEGSRRPSSRQSEKRPSPSRTRSVLWTKGC